MTNTLSWPIGQLDLNPVPGQPFPVTLLFDEESWPEGPPTGTYTVSIGGIDPITATRSSDRITFTLDGPSTVVAYNNGHRIWRLRRNGSDWIGGRIGLAEPQSTPGSLSATVGVSEGEVQVTVVGAGGGGSGPALSDETPEALGEAGPGESDEASRADHVHPMPTAADVGALPADTPIPPPAPVDSVNNKTGVVVLDASDVGADPAGSAAAITLSGLGGVADDDPRLSDARTPLAHAASHAPGGSDPLDIPAAIAASPTPPESPSEGDYWLRTAEGLYASQDWRALNDGAPAGIGTSGDPSSWTPFTNGPGSLGSLVTLDSHYLGAPGVAPVEVVNGVSRGPAVGSMAGARTVASTLLPEGPTGIVRFTVKLAEWGDQVAWDETDAGSTVNVTLTDFTGVGPIAHFSRLPADEEMKHYVKVGIDTPSAVTSVVEVDRIAGGDRCTLAVDEPNRQWWVELNGQMVEGTLTELEDDGSGGENVIVDGGAPIGNLPAPLDFSGLIVAANPINSGFVSDPSPAIAGWRGGVEWWAYSTHDYDPDAITLHRRVDDDWQPVIRPATPQPSPLRAASMIQVGPGLSLTQNADGTVTIDVNP